MKTGNQFRKSEKLKAGVLKWSIKFINLSPA